MHLLKSMGMETGMKPNSYFSSFSQENVDVKSKNQTKSKIQTYKEFIPQKYALDYNPPCIILEYRNPENKKLYHHKMMLKKMNKQTTIQQALDYLKKKHSIYFKAKIIDEDQIGKLFEKLKKGIQNIQQSINEQDFDFDYGDDFEENDE